MKPGDDSDLSEIDPEVRHPSSSNPLFVVDPPPNLATADRAEIRAWAAQMIAAFKEQNNWSEEPN